LAEQVFVNPKLAAGVTAMIVYLHMLIGRLFLLTRGMAGSEMLLRLRSEMKS